MAKRAEHGFRHTAMIHSNNVRNMTKMGKAMDTTLFVKNGPCMAGLGLGGEGYIVVLDRHADRRRRDHAADVHPRAPLHDGRRLADPGEMMRRNAYSAASWVSATATVKHPSMEGAKLLLVMALQADGRTHRGRSDPGGRYAGRRAGRDGDDHQRRHQGTRELLQSDNTPVRWAVLGIPD